MKPDDKELLLKDLCARLPYGVKAQVLGWDEEKGEVEVPLKIYSINTDGYVYFESNDYDVNYLPVEDVRLYLRPMSSMTEEERELLNRMALENSLKCIEEEDPQKVFLLRVKHDAEELAYLYEHHYDVFGLIPAGLALSAETFNSYAED